MCCGSRPGSRCAGSPAASEHLEGPPLTAAWSLGSCRQLLGGGRCGSRWVSSVTLSPQDPTRGAPSLASWRTPVAHRTCAASGPGAKAGISGPRGAEGTPRPARRSRSASISGPLAPKVVTSSARRVGKMGRAGVRKGVPLATCSLKLSTRRNQAHPHLVCFPPVVHVCENHRKLLTF